MQGMLPPACAILCLLLVVVPAADAACNRTAPVIIPTTINYPPGPWGTINVESDPAGAAVYLDDEMKGTAPLTISGVWQGTYTIKAVMPGFQDYTTTTTITGPYVSYVYCPLAPDTSGSGLYVTSTPSGADVYLNNTLKGKTPLMMRDPGAGIHNIIIRLPGYADWKSNVEIPEAGTATVMASLQETDTNPDQGLDITSDPSGATIILDGREKGITPKILNTISPGIHILEIQYPGYIPWKSTVDVPETTIREIAVNLTADPATAPGRIRVTSDPAGSSVVIDSAYAGTTSAGTSLDPGPRPPGEYTLVISHPGYKPYTTRVVVIAGNVTDIDAMLDPVLGTTARGNLSVSTEPAGATVRVDNETIGSSPIADYQLAAGKHQVTLLLKGYADYSTDIVIPADESSTISVSLRKGTSSVYSPSSLLTVLGALAIAIGIALRKYR